MTDKNARPGRRVGSQNRESIWLCSGSTKRYLWANSTDIEKETATNRSSTTRTGTVRYGLKIISFEVTVRTDKDIVVCLTFGHHQISHTHTHKILFLVKLKRNQFQKLVIIILIIFIYISTITVIYQCNSSTFFFYLRF